MRFIENKKLATRIGIITTAIILIGMILLWFAVSTALGDEVRDLLSDSYNKTKFAKQIG